MTALQPPRAGSRIAELLGVATVVFTLMLVADVIFLVFGLAGALANELLLVLLPAILVAWSMPLDLVVVFRLRRPPLAALVAALVLAPAACLLASTILAVDLRLLEIDPAELEAWTRLEVLAGRSPGLAVLALVVAPALAEEALFRGVLLGSLERRLGPRAAIVVSALLFALFHRSHHRWLAHGLLGLLLGALAVRSRSLVPPIALHLVYNLGILTAGRQLQEIALEPSALWIAAALLALGLRLLAACPSGRRNDGCRGAGVLGA